MQQCCNFFRYDVKPIEFMITFAHKTNKKMNRITIRAIIRANENMMTRPMSYFRNVSTGKGVVRIYTSRRGKSVTRSLTIAQVKSAFGKAMKETVS